MRCQAIYRGRYREKWSLTDTGIEEVSRNKSSDTRIEARSIHQVSRSYRRGRNFLDQSTRCREAVEIAIKKAEEARQTARYRGGVELAYKSNFQEVKNTDMNAIQYATQPMIQSTQ